MKSLSVWSSAKVNLSLRVVGKLPDGYHELCTLFHRITLADRLTLRKIPKGFRFQCDSPHVPQDGNNLAVKAYRLLCQETGLKGGVEIRLEKRVPVAAGLGGGSSNAASTLLALNRLFGLGLGRDCLVALGKKLGADVPFFLLEAPQAVGCGRGDDLTVIKESTNLLLCLTFLPGGLSTRGVYNKLQSPGNGPSLTKLSCDATMLSAFLASRDLGSCTGLLRNDLLKPASQIKPAIGRVLSFLRVRWPASLMSGSGPTLFTLTETLNEALSCQRRVFRALGLASWVGRLG